MMQKEDKTGVVHLRVQAARSLSETLTGVAESVPFNLLLFMGCVYVDGRRERRDIQVQPGQLIRLHTRPKHYVPLPLDLKSRIVFHHREFLALDKPAGLPTHPTLDNYIENVKYQLEQELGYPIYITHRLDITTEGLLILAKTKDAQALINKCFAKGRVQKIYQALTAKPVMPGLTLISWTPKAGCLSK